MGNNMGERLAKHFEVDSNNEGGVIYLFYQYRSLPFFSKKLL